MEMRMPARPGRRLRRISNTAYKQVITHLHRIRSCCRPAPCKLSFTSIIAARLNHLLFITLTIITRALTQAELTFTRESSRAVPPNYPDALPLFLTLPDSRAAASASC